MSNTATWPSKRTAAPETSGLPSRTHTRFTACRVAKLSLPSSTISAAAASVSRRFSSTRSASAATADLRVDPGERRARRFGLLHAHRLHAVHDLALEVGEIHVVAVADRQAADAGGSEIQRHRRAEPARADDEGVRGEQLLLPLDADLRQQDVAAVAQELVVVHARSVRRQRSRCEASVKQNARLAPGVPGRGGPRSTSKPRSAGPRRGSSGTRSPGSARSRAQRRLRPAPASAASRRRPWDAASG